MQHLSLTDHTYTTLVAKLAPTMNQSDQLAQFPAVAIATPLSMAVCSLSKQDCITTYTITTDTQVKHATS